MIQSFNDNPDIKLLVKQISEELNIPEVVVLSAYKSFWKFIKEKIEQLPLKEDLTEEDFKKLRTSFNIPSIGKLYTTFEKISFIKNSFKNKDK